MYDVIIAGCGIAGGSIARSLDGLNVLVLEKNKKVVPKDSGIVSKKFFRYYGRKFISHEISEMELVAPGGTSFFIRDDSPYAYIIDRERFSKFLVKEAKNKAEFRNETLLSVKTGKTGARVLTNKGEYEGRLVIGCDGASSVVRKSAGIPPMKTSLGLMVKGSGLKKHPIKVFFNKSYSPDFFSWVIPASDEYGLIAGENSAAYLKRFCAGQNLKKGRLYASLIPIGTTKSFSNRCILVGDACGQNKPLTGGGIVFSLISSSHAVDTVKAAFARQRFDEKMLSAYEREWKAALGFEIRKQLLVRKAYAKAGNSQINSIFRDFGRPMENLRGFDYDSFSRSWRCLPKFKLLKHMLLNFHRIF